MYLVLIEDEVCVNDFYFLRMFATFKGQFGLPDNIFIHGIMLRYNM